MKKIRKTVFIVEDDPVYRQIMVELLTGNGYKVFEWDTGEGAVERISSIRPHIVVLDVELPGMLGTEICKRLRQIEDLASMPIVLATGSDADVHYLAGVDFKATTSFSKARKPAILLATINALARQVAVKNSLEAAIVIGNLGDFCIDPKNQRIQLKGATFSLPSKPFTLMRLLVQNRPRPVNRQEILRRLKIRHNGEKEIDVFLHTIREAFGELGPSLFRNVRGKGFFFDESALTVPKTAAADS